MPAEAELPCVRPEPPDVVVEELTTPLLECTVTEEPPGRVLDPLKPLCPEPTLPDEVQRVPAQELVLPGSPAFERACELVLACGPVPLAAEADECDVPLATQGSFAGLAGS